MHLFLSFVKAVCAKELKKECKEWIDWFHNQEVPNEAKLNQLHYRNSEGYSALHYAALHYRPDILSMALDITGGTTHMYMYLLYCNAYTMLQCSYVYLHLLHSKISSYSIPLCTSNYSLIISTAFLILFSQQLISI